MNPSGPRQGSAGAAADLDARVRQLSPRHKECLRHVYDRRTSKQIAAALGLSVGTVTTYCTEAIRILGATDRRHAAELLHGAEVRTDDARATPSGTEPPSAGVGRPVIWAPVPEPAALPWSRLLPFRTKDASGNDLPVLLRLAWIPALAILLAIGFSAVVSAVHLIDDIVRHR